MVTQHFSLVQPMTVTENVILGRARGARLDLAAARRSVEAAAERFGIAVRPDAIVCGALGRRAAARRDPQGAVPRLPRAHPRRADGRARAARGGGALRDAAAPRRRGPLGRLHQPQAGRGARHQRPRQRPAARAHGRHRPGLHRRARAGTHDGRPADLRRRAAETIGAAASRASGSARSRRWADTGCPPCTTSRSRCTPARSSAWPASPATARPSWSRSSPACAP